MMRRPSKAQQQARWLNAQRIAKHIQSLIDAGYIVRDEHDGVVAQIEITEDAIYRSHKKNSNCTYIMYQNNAEWDHGAYDTIAEYNAKFNNWTAYKPQDMLGVRL